MRGCHQRFLQVFFFSERIIPESETCESQKRNESEDLFTENPSKKKKHTEVDEKNDATYCSSPSYEYKQEDEYSQYAQRWSSPDYTDNESKKPSLNSQKQFSDAAVMTTRPDNYYVEENNENIRISNLMFCKFISHELDRLDTDDERYTIMQQIIGVFKKKNT